MMRSTKSAGGHTGMTLHQGAELAAVALNPDPLGEHRVIVHALVEMAILVPNEDEAVGHTGAARAGKGCDREPTVRPRNWS